MHSKSNIAASATLLFVLTGAGALTGATSLADALTEPQELGPPPDGSGPPRVAFEACASQKQNDVCTVNFRDREIHGHCVPDRDRKLFCIPDERPPALPRDRAR